MKRKIFKLTLDRSGSFKKNDKGILYFWKLDNNVYILTKALADNDIYEIDYVKENNIFIKPVKDDDIIEENNLYKLFVFNTENYYLTENKEDMYLINRNKNLEFDILLQKDLDYGKLFVVLYLNYNNKKLFDLELNGKVLIEIYKKEQAKK